VLIIRRSKLHYTASGIITPIGGRLVHGLREDSLLLVTNQKYLCQMLNGGKIFDYFLSTVCMINKYSPCFLHLCSK